MKKSLQSPLCFVALFFLLLSSVAGAERPGTDQSGKNRLNPVRLVLADGRSVTFNAPADITVSTDPWLNIATNVPLGAASVSSGDGRSAFTISNNAPNGFPIGTTDVTWKAADADGNVLTAVQKVTVVDTEKPYIARMFEISVVNDPGQCGAAVQLFTPDYYDNSGSVTFTNDAPAYFPVGSFLVTWTGTDRYGNSDTATQWITVIDNELPSISTTDITVNSEPAKNGATVNLGTPVTADNCGVVSVENDAPAFFPIGTTVVHWTVTDKVGYTNVTTQTVVVVDNEKPKITPPATITLNNTPGQCGSSAALAPPAVSDNSGSVVISNNVNGQLPTGTNLVTWTATDNSGNQTSATQTVIVKDAEAPVFTNAPANATVSCDGIPAATKPVVSDNCTASPVVTFSQVSTQGSGTTSVTRYNYAITRTWTAKDAAGNTATAKQVITVQDRTAPVISVPSNISKANDLNACGAVVTYTASAVDNCGSPVTLTYSKNPGSTFATGSTVVTVTAKDVSGNTSTKSFTITVTDTQKPVLKAPSNISASTGNSSVSNVNLGTPTASDNCGIRSITNNAPASYPVGTTTVTWTATDVNNNTTTATQTVTVTSTRKKASNNAAVAFAGGLKETATEEALQITVAPNPSTGYFTLKIQARNGQPVYLRVVDAQGRVVDAKAGLAANSTIQVGHSYLPGSYFAEFIQGSERKVIQLLKVR
ncbi:HYR domain-containing protein [Sediminibacterium roseum]|uniref:HYR domain-containing protein n=1 Tax=Sediminibacterium roseum TaxID=1978412 RepID=A0ABW9ZUX5_9BACT|nr:HYR domain-containing protein [Sediminibacterium roseum]NCI49542.1 HYR domain-containing protein [Sediminibacterium roseum]